MRPTALIGPCLALSLVATAGCDPLQEQRFFRDGIGSNLNGPEIADATTLLTQYIGYICKQAGLELIPDQPAASCSDRTFTQEHWVQFVKAGMNDIDQRCDAYLAWLDNRRRSAEPLLRQIGDMGKATGSILDATGVGPHAMNIVGMAFGLAANTFTNVNSRLLLEVNQATVQSVVHKGQEEFRNRKDYTNTFSRSDAIYHLRSYLRLCMPFTIETDINTTVAIAKRVGPVSLENNPLIAPEIAAPDLGAPGAPPIARAATIPPAAGALQSRSDRKLAANGRAAPKRNAALEMIFRDYSPQEFPPSTVEKILKVLCVPRAEWARVGERLAQARRDLGENRDGPHRRRRPGGQAGKGFAHQHVRLPDRQGEEFLRAAAVQGRCGDGYCRCHRSPEPPVGQQAAGLRKIAAEPGSQRSEDQSTHSPSQTRPRQGPSARRQARVVAGQHGQSMDAGLGRDTVAPARSATG